MTSESETDEQEMSQKKALILTGVMLLSLLVLGAVTWYFVLNIQPSL